MKFEGVVTVVKRKATTHDDGTVEVGEILHEYPPIKNTITFDLTRRMLDQTIASSTRIFISTSPQISKYVTTRIESAYDVGFVESGVISPRLVKMVAPDNSNITFQNRFNPPTAGQTRTIRIIGLQGISTFQSTPTPVACVTLSTPCTQTDTEVLDVFYRIVMVRSNQDQNIPYGTLEFYMDYLMNGPTNMSLSSAYTSMYENAWDANIRNDGGSAFDGSTGITTITKQYSTGLRNVSTTFTTSTLVGNIIGSVGYGTAFRQLFGTRLTNITDSPIQSIFGHNMNATAPFQDVNFLANGTGTLTPSTVNWTGTHPSYFRININLSGATGVATYNFQVRKHVGFFGNTYSSNLAVVTCTANVSGSTYPYTLTPFSNGDVVYGITDSANSFFLPLDGKRKVLGFSANGITVVDVVSNTRKSYTSTTTPSIPLSSFRIAKYHAPSDTILVADANTGLWRISSDGLTTTQITNVPTVDNNKCYALDIKPNGDIFAIFDGGLAVSTNNGAGWSVYDHTTSTRFSVSGVTPSNYSAVTNIVVDPSSSNNRLLIITNENSSRWWSVAGSSGGVSDDTAGPSFTMVASKTSNFSFACSSDGVWFGVPSNNVFKLTYGATSLTSIGTANSTWQSLCLVPTPTGETRPLIRTGNGIIRLVSSTGTVIWEQNISSSNPAWFYPTGAMIYIGDGLVVDMFTPNMATTFRGLIIFSLCGSTPLSVINTYLIWKTYGWDGSQWVEGHPGSKVTHTTSEALLEGVSISFQNGSTGTSFVNTDYYTFSVNRGVLKDNATTGRYAASLYHLPTKHNVTDIVSSVVPSSPVGILTEPIGWINPTTNDSQQGFMLGMIGWNSTGGAQTEQTLVGDGEYTFKTTVSSSSINVHIGIIANGNVSGVSTSSLTHAFVFNGTTLTIRESGATKTTVSGGFTQGDSFTIKRVGNTITYLKNGSLIYTSLVSSSSEVCMVAAAFSTTYFYIYDCVVSYNLQKITVDIGDSLNQTGRFDSNFGLIEYNNDEVNTTAVTINGVSVPVSRNPLTVPAVGTATLLYGTGRLWFNAADVGKTITSSVIQINIPQ